MTTLRLDSPLTREHAARVIAALDQARDSDVEIDLTEVREIDSAGVAILAAFARAARGRGQTVRVTSVHPDVRRTLDLFPYPGSEATERPPRASVALRAGEWALQARGVLLEYLVLCGDILWFSVSAIFTRSIRWRDLGQQMSLIGSQAFGVVGLIAFLVGGTLALQGAAQLRQFGANIFIVDLVGISITRELGPLMTAIMIAGRSGSSIAAELGTMVVTEEIDALRTMGLHPTRFLVVPRAMAITVTQPMLTMYANTLAMFGGFLVAVTYLDVGPEPFMTRLQQALYFKDLMTGLFKSVVFANIIVSVGALCGLRTGGGADAVGRSTTTSVVAGIFAVIVADAVFSLIFYFGE